MPFATVKLKPGINVEYTPVLNEAGYSQSQLGRFKAELFQKIGGWTNTTIYPNDLTGITKALHPWQDLNNNKYLLAGTTQKLNVIQNLALKDVTPQTKTTTPTGFSIDNTVVGEESLVTITDPNVGTIEYDDFIYFNTPVQIGNIILSGLYKVYAYVGANTYTIDAGINATSKTTTFALPVFTTTNGSSTVKVTLNGHGQIVGNVVDFPIATTANGVTILGTYTVILINSANQFSIVANTTATASSSFTMNSGSAQLVYYLTIGPPPAALGWDVGNYGLTGGYNVGASTSAQTGTPITTTDWTLDNFGLFGLACPKGSGIYYYDPNAGFTTAQLIPNCPIFNAGMFVAMPQQQIIAYGSSTGLDLGLVQDPLLVRWCDVGDFTTWDAASANQAGSYRISTGSYIVSGLQGPQNGLLWTDLDLWAMSYIGQPLVYGFNKIGTNCGLIGQHAMTTLLGNVYWMGQSNFFMMAGNGIQVIPCPVWDAVFQNLNSTNKYKSVACANTPFNEVWWFYPSSSATEPDSYVKYNIAEQSWDYGSLSRTAWTDQSVLGPPIAASSDGSLYQHEVTNDGNGQPITSSLQTGYWMLAEGEEIVFVDWILPDFKWGLFNGTQNANLQITIYGTDYPGDTPRVYGPYTVTATSQYINTRIRARYMAMKVESSDLGSFWRLGGVKYRWSADGRR